MWAISTKYWESTSVVSLRVTEANKDLPSWIRLSTEYSCPAIFCSTRMVSCPGYSCSCATNSAGSCTVQTPWLECLVAGLTTAGNRTDPWSTDSRAPGGISTDAGLRSGRYQRWRYLLRQARAARNPGNGRSK